MSLFMRAVVAILLMIGFYLLAVAIAAGLIAIPVLEVVYANRIHPKLVVICIGGGLVILWAILPRWDRFEPPGPRLIPSQHPRLMAEISRIAQASGQPVPEEVYLCPDVNAWVAQRGGIMGFGSRPVMGLGLPLLQVLNVSELRAVLAHEFGHFCSSDTKLGPWVYKTRAAIGRTIGSLGDSFLRWPFLIYGKMFLRITHAVSRAQEFAADALAARIAGARHVISSLRKTQAAAPAFGAYWQNEVVPVLSCGFRPPLAEGFAGFLQAKAVGESVAKIVAESLKASHADPYDTHPALLERIKAVEGLPAGAQGSDAPAITLLDNVSQLERELLAAVAGEARVGKLEAIAWNDAGPRVYLPLWVTLVEQNAQALAAVTPRQFPALLADAGFLKQVRCYDGSKPAPRDAAGQALAVLATALLLKARQQGWNVICLPGEPISFEHNGANFAPFNALGAVLEKEKSADAWLTEISALGLSDLDLTPTRDGSAVPSKKG